MKLTMDLAQEGLLMFFKPYQIEALDVLWDSDRVMSSYEVWDAVGSDMISRASIINFLNDAVENGLLDMTTMTGKGGHRGIYKPKYTKEGTKVIKTAFRERLDSL